MQTLTVVIKEKHFRDSIEALSKGGSPSHCDPVCLSVKELFPNSIVHASSTHLFVGKDRYYSADYCLFALIFEEIRKYLKSALSSHSPAVSSKPLYAFTFKKVEFNEL